MFNKFGALAQLVEQGTENPRVLGSIPRRAKFFVKNIFRAKIEFNFTISPVFKAFVCYSKIRLTIFMQCISIVLIIFLFMVPLFTAKKEWQIWIKIAFFLKL